MTVDGRSEMALASSRWQWHSWRKVGTITLALFQTDAFSVQVEPRETINCKKESDRRSFFSSIAASSSIAFVSSMVLLPCNEAFARDVVETAMTTPSITEGELTVSSPPVSVIL